MLQLLGNDLTSDDTILLAPASPEVLGRLGDTFGNKVDPFFLELYRVFGGHAAADGAMVALWSPERIIAEKDTTMIGGRNYHAIGDLMIDSDFLMVCLDDAEAPAYLLHAGDRIADSAVALVEAIVAGRLVP